MQEVVVVATDFSSVAAQALEVGRRLAERLMIPLELLHVREGLGRRSPWAPDADEEEWLHGAGLTQDQVVLRSGTPWLEIVRYAQERPAEVVVLGTHGSTGFQPLSLGATAGRLAILSPRPVLLVGPKTRNGNSAG
jgi:nucleotide-binding universal stress UspA family protein